jgi:hypothetical protein
LWVVVVGEVAEGDRLVAVRAGPAVVDALAEQVAVGAAALVEVAGVAVGALVDDCKARAGITASPRVG